MLDFAIQTARQAGALLRDYRSRQRTLAYKGAVDLTTDADRASEELIVGAITAAFPHHAIVAEEGSGVAASSAYTWVVDPLDGTTNYAHDLPFFSVSIGLLHEGQLHLGVVYDPLRDELFAGQRGQGATCNGKPLTVSSTATLTESCCTTGFPYDRRERPDNNLPEFGRVLLRARDVRRLGSAALELSYVAAGRLQAHWELRLKPWDTAAGALLVLESGGQISGIDGSPWSPDSPTMVASNGQIHAELLDVLRGA